MKTVLIVIDGFGIGEAPDAAIFGDIGANTYGSLSDKTALPTMQKLGLNNIFGVQREGCDNPIGNYARMRELSSGKDTLSGHHEMAGVVTRIAAPTYPQGFHKEIIAKLEKAFGRKILGNVVASGTEIINRLGDEHMLSGSPIVYTSADSVLQIACHEGVISLGELYAMCQKAREIMRGSDAVGRIIARPFLGENGNYSRTENRRDYGLHPLSETMLDRLQTNGIKTVAIGKIYDIFSGKGIEECLEAHSNYDVGKELVRACATMDNCLIFANFVDTDMLYGHRRDAYGYQMCLEQVDTVIEGVLETMLDDDVLIVTSDHGCDPGFASSTDHTREYVPLLIYGKNLASGVDFGTVHGLDTIAHTVLDIFDIMSLPKSLKPQLVPKQASKNLVSMFTTPMKNAVTKSKQRKLDNGKNS